MHMADALLSPAVGTTMCAVSIAANALAVRKIKHEDLSEKKIPVMGVMGAFVFAAQMINFTIPVTGSSGHIGGGIMLAAIIGGFPALLSLSVVLAIQCLFFADGGLLALGCNIFNLGVIPCLVIYPLLFKPLLKRGITAGRITLAALMSVILSLQLGAFGVVLETWWSGITELPFTTFLLFMQPIHLAIGLVEGVVTAGILCFVHQMRPEIMESTIHARSIGAGVSLKKPIIILAIATVFTGGILSYLASSHPDGLEWAIDKAAAGKTSSPAMLDEAAAPGDTSDEISGEMGTEALHPVLAEAGRIREATAVMPGYDFKNAGEEGTAAGVGVAGIVGGGLTFALAAAAAVLISALKKKQKKNAVIAD